MKEFSPVSFSDACGWALIVALSGGADSVSLLHMLARQRQALDLRLLAVHVEHGIRGEDSRADAEFCKSVCHSLDVPIQIVSLDVPAEAKRTGQGLETVARAMRYAALDRILAEAHADRIALAHHLNDQAETVLMHLLRGCGLKGACGMARDDGRLYRPLLNAKKSDLEKYLLDRGLSWRTDCTNGIPDTPRNALRLHGIPALEESYSSAQEAIARFAECAQIENRFMERETERFLNARLETGPYGARILHPEQADEAILRRAIERVCPSDYLTIAAVARLAQSARGKRTISKSCIAERTPDAIYFLKRAPQLPAPAFLPMEGCAALGILGQMRVARCAAVPVRDDPFRQALRRDALEGAILRTRRDGDRIRPLGCGEKSLSDFFIDRRIDRPLRDFIPLVARGNEILWAVGCAISESARLRSDADDALELCWKPCFKPET